MRVAVVPGDDSGCGRYRLIMPASVVSQIRPKWEVEIYRPGSVQVSVDPDGKLRHVRGLDPEGLDLLIMQRVGSLGPLLFTDWARERGIATLVDADDAMWCIDPDNFSYKAWNSKQNHWSRMDAAADRADLMTVTTKGLADRYGKHGRCEIIPNTIPAEVLEWENMRHGWDNSTVAVGWAGTTGTHPHDLQVVGDAVQRALAVTGAVARVVSDAKGAARAWGLSHIEEIPPQPFGLPYFTALSSVDIGLVPLTPGKFNHCKSSLKALEYSAMGVPVIASPTPANQELQKSGVPILLASTPEDWYGHLLHLISSTADRELLGAQAREVVREKWTTEDHAERWAAAWERAVARRRALLR